MFAIMEKGISRKVLLLPSYCLKTQNDNTDSGHNAGLPKFEPQRAEEPLAVLTMGRLNKRNSKSGLVWTRQQINPVMCHKLILLR